MSGGAVDTTGRGCAAGVPVGGLSADDSGRG